MAKGKTDAFECLTGSLLHVTTDSIGFCVTLDEALIPRLVLILDGSGTETCKGFLVESGLRGLDDGMRRRKRDRRRRWSDLMRGE
ncbi:MAG TPA: hypothetical protein VMX35_00025 [Acidobacteriota bacterium]|nr:hypothetical protein [Acidobacteriota bacterium]